MDILHQIGDYGGSFSSDDNEDSSLFEHSRLSRQILRIKHNDPEVTTIELFSGEEMNDRRWSRLGSILGQNTRILELGLTSRDLNVVGFCNGLKINKSIKRIWLIGTDLRRAEDMKSFGQFIGNNPRLKTVSLMACSLGIDSISALSEALLNRSEDVAIEKLVLSCINFGDICLDDLARACLRNTALATLRLTQNGIGLNGCTSIAKLLANDQLALESLFLDENSIEDDSALVLAKSLAKNAKLRILSLRANNISTVGWSAILKLVCNSSSLDNILQSNHTLYDLGVQMLSLDRELVDEALGEDNGNLLRVSLELNRSPNKVIVARNKILWCHTRCDFNIGDAPLCLGALPHVLAWLGDNSNIDPTNRSLPLDKVYQTCITQYLEPTLTKNKVDTLRLNAIYSIIRTRDDISMAADLEQDEKNANAMLEMCLILLELLIMPALMEPYVAGTMLEPFVSGCQTSFQAIVLPLVFFALLVSYTVFFALYNQEVGLLLATLLFCWIMSTHAKLVICLILLALLIMHMVMLEQYDYRFALYSQVGLILATLLFCGSMSRQR